MELRQKKKRNEGLGFKGGDAVELDRYIARAESAAAQAVESAAAAAAQLGQVGMNADAIAALRRDVDSIGEELPGKYTIPVEGIPETDLSADVRASLGRADTALQPDALSAYRTAAAQDEIDGGKQAKLVSGENIKTVNGQTILGAGDLVIQYSRPNLLDNWYFVGGGSQLGDGVFPINQRGQAAYSGAGYSIDRWELGAGSGITIYSNYVELKSIASPSRRFRQTLTLPAGKYTFSCLLASGSNNNGSADVNGASITLKEGTLTSYTVTHAGGSFSVSLSSGAEGKKINIIACKLELGSYQTLAHNEGTDAIPIWVLNEIPAYSEEFKKCLMYFERVKGQWSIPKLKLLRLRCRERFIFNLQTTLVQTLQCLLRSRLFLRCRLVTSRSFASLQIWCKENLTKLSSVTRQVILTSLPNKEDDYVHYSGNSDQRK